MHTHMYMVKRCLIYDLELDTAGHSNSGDEEAAHWSEMKDSRGTYVNRWHTLVDS